LQCDPYQSVHADLQKRLSLRGIAFDYIDTNS
jgi:hypothetical protein